MKRPGNTNLPYKILRPVITGLFKLYYNPKTINKIKVPKKGAIILCGNHIHTHDQFMAVGCTKRVVHYMAKKEYFDGKGAFFFKLAGCIPVDRSIKDETAKGEAIDILKSGGALGLFPEGTRNEVTCKKDKLNTLYDILKNDMSKEELIKLIKPIGIKYTQVELLIELESKKIITKEELKEYVLDADSSLRKLLKEKKITKSEYKNSLLIPLKFGAVSMAQKTDATIIPFAVNGKYEFRSKNLRIKFGKPFKVTDITLEEANKKLDNTIKNLILDLKGESNGKEENK